MSVSMIFNDISSNPPAQNKLIARAWISNLSKTLLRAINNGVQGQLRTNQNFYSLSLATDYTFGCWCVDSEVDIEERRFIMSIASKPPYIDKDSKLLEILKTTEFIIENLTVTALGVAYITESIGISLPSIPIWDTSCLQLVRKEINEGEAITESTISVKHASIPNHITDHISWIRNKIIANIKNGSELLERSKILFPNLDFCPGAHNQLRSLLRTEPQFKSILTKLFVLEDYCKDWNSGGFNTNNLGCPVSSESTPTINKYGTFRTFKCHDEEDRLFVLHIRVYPDNWRIHFLPQESEKKVLIGYLGPHLPTVSDPT